MSLNVTKSPEMSQNVTKCQQMTPNVTKYQQMSSNVTKCHQMSQNVTKMSKNGFGVVVDGGQGCGSDDVGNGCDGGVVHSQCGHD